MSPAGRLALALAAAAVALPACRRAEPLPVLGSVPAFQLTSQAGTPVGADALRGHVWIANFVFTRCPDVCPVLTQRMRQVAGRVPLGPEGVRLVSISVDPLHDTPEVLAAYAKRYEAPADWSFLTGDRAAVAALLRDGFKVPYTDDGPPEQPIAHSERFVLVDPDLEIRGYYSGLDPDSLDRLVADARRLLDEQPRG